ncbi:hypothetical protein PsYK624_170270 [Phanerochaete sordida]|uniref:Uncharacterized protein n=1 Tax=Phanerochaete sordida TaxID=48140 RepID=A0A9P3GTE0_9APHY|nr:hypothetical protein PsYK624_170270 [Phanerochaete sordida]
MSYTLQAGALPFAALEGSSRNRSWLHLGTPAIPELHATGTSTRNLSCMRSLTRLSPGPFSWRRPSRFPYPASRAARSQSLTARSWRTSSSKLGTRESGAGDGRWEPAAAWLRDRLLLAASIVRTTRLAVSAGAELRLLTASWASAHSRSRADRSTQALRAVARRSPPCRGAPDAIPRRTAPPVISSSHRSPTLDTPSHWQCVRRSSVRSMLVASSARSAAANIACIDCR